MWPPTFDLWWSSYRKLGLGNADTIVCKKGLHISTSPLHDNGKQKKNPDHAQLAWVVRKKKLPKQIISAH